MGTIAPSQRRSITSQSLSGSQSPAATLSGAGCAKAAVPVPITKPPLEERAVPEVAAEGRGAGHAGQGIGTLYEEPEKPNGALDFLKHHLGAATPENPEIKLLRLELAEMKEKYEAIVEERKKKLKARLAQYEPPQEEKHAE